MDLVFRGAVLFALKKHSPALKVVVGKGIFCAEPVDNLLKRKEVCIMSPVPVTLPGQTQIAQSPNGGEAGACDSARTTGRYLRHLGFHVMAVLLGIALAFM